MQNILYFVIKVDSNLEFLTKQIDLTFDTKENSLLISATSCVIPSNELKTTRKFYFIVKFRSLC